MPVEFRDRFPEINPVVLQLLYSRGIDTQEKVDEFFNPDYEQDLHDPFIFQDMAKAVKRIFAAIKKGEKIVVHGDYDADGVTASTVMMTTLRKMVEIFGKKEKIDTLFDVYIPHREKEGYGFQIPTAQYFIDNKIDLVITVDCGVSDAPAVEFCSKAGIDVIVTDHHQEPVTLPAAYAIINPQLAREKYPFRQLAGVGVAFKVAQALIAEAKKKNDKENWEGFEKWLLDLVAIGTVADVMPLLGENRTLVRYGLVVLNKTPRLGLKALFKQAGISGNGGVPSSFRDDLPKKGLNSYSIAFQISPRLNAAGRMDHANNAYGLLMTTDEQEAESMAEQIQKSNSARQTLTENIISQVEKNLGQQASADEKLLIGIGDNWPTGILGLVAGRLCERFYRPVVIISRFEGKIVGSGRGIDGSDITVPLKGLEKYLYRYGGHAQANGFTLKPEASLEEFVVEYKKALAVQLEKVELMSFLEIDSEVDLADVSWPLYDELEKMEPFGEGNVRPRFLATGLEVDSVEKMGKDMKHLKLLVRQNNGMVRKLIGFGKVIDFASIKKGDKIDAVIDVGINEWNGSRELQLKIADLKIHS